MSKTLSSGDTANFAKIDTAVIRADFPILQQSIHRNRKLIYLDNGASTQHPLSVIESMNRCYRETYANVHRGIHWLSEQSSAQFEQARQRVQQFLNAAHSEEIIFTSGTTAGINLVARSWGGSKLQPDDEILLSLAEHHSNIVPWQQIAQQTGARIEFVGLSPEGEFDWEDFEAKLNRRTRIVAVTAISNVLGCRYPVKQIAAMAKNVGAVCLIDAAQQVPHEPTDVQFWGADFVTFSGHKMLGPSGIGILYGRRELLNSMPAFLGGGGMINRVTVDGFTEGELPAKFEAGTPPIAEAIGLAAAVDYLEKLDLNAIAAHEHELVKAAWEGVSQIPGVRILGPPSDRRSGMISFSVDGISAQDIAILLDRKGIAIRAGHHCAMPLHDALKVRASCRASFYLYNTLGEIEAFVNELAAAVQRLR